MRSDEASGAAADTGSAVHKAAAVFHKRRLDVAIALRAMRDHLPEYPEADLGSAEEQFWHYCRDERNLAAKVVLIEEEITVTLPPPEGDSQAVEIRGHLDQVRESSGVLTVWDIKTGGQHEGDEMLSQHAAQLMAYQIGACQRLSRCVQSAGIIRTKDYLKKDRKKNSKPGPVFWPASWTHVDAREMLMEVVRIVGDIRRGVIRVTPSAANCQYCPGLGVANCLPSRKSLTLI